MNEAEVPRMTQAQFDRMDSTVSAGLKGSTVDDQKRYGTHDTVLMELQNEFIEVMKAGHSELEVLEGTMVDLLKRCEVIRISQDQAIHEYELKMAQCRARQQFASQFKSMLVDALTKQIHVAKKKKEQSRLKEGEVLSESGVVRKTDTEALKTHCAQCGCLPNRPEDDCECDCHVLGWCSHPDCSPCAEAKAAARKKETSSRRRATAPKKKKAKK